MREAEICVVELRLSVSRLLGCPAEDRPTMSSSKSSGEDPGGLSQDDPDKLIDQQEALFRDVEGSRGNGKDNSRSEAAKHR